jgi:hypothetical protein
MAIAGALAAGGGVIAFATIRNTTPVARVTRPTPLEPCGDPCLKVDALSR